MNKFPDAIFKAYDIRGIVDETLNKEIVYKIGQALGTIAKQQQQQTFAIGRDGRLSGPKLSKSLIEGIISCGIDVIDIGCVPTPISYFASYYLQTNNCVSVTGSHNPPNYNGLKMVVNGKTIFGEQIQALKTQIQNNDFATGQGEIKQIDVIPAYINKICDDIKLARKMKVVVDCGNGVAGAVAPQLLTQLGCEVIPLYCEVDGNFPNHHPDPSKPENLTDLIQALHDNDAEIGLAFDGDGDRLGVVTKDGEIIFPDRQLLLFAEDVLKRVPGGQIIYDVKCTRLLSSWIKERGGIPLMWNTGHALIKAKLQETGAPLAGEMSGHIFFKERWFGFDDGIYAAARLLEIVSQVADANVLLKSLPKLCSTPELNIELAEGEPFKLVERLKQQAQFTDAKEIITIDGLRVEFADGFGLVRPSNTTPVVVLRFEADNQIALNRITSIFRQQIEQLWPQAKCPF